MTQSSLRTAALVGAAGALLVGAPARAEAPDFSLLHADPVLVEHGAGAHLTFGTLCWGPVAMEGHCDVDVADLFVRRGTTGGFTKVTLSDSARPGWFEADVPTEFSTAPEGFSYYAAFHDATHDVSLVEPLGGAADPYVVRVAGVPVDASTSTASARLARTRTLVSMRWGSGPGDVGLLAGGVPWGPSSLDVYRGRVSVLDNQNARLLRFVRKGATYRRVATVPAATVPRLGATLAVAANGTAFVAGDQSHIALRVYTPRGRRLKAPQFRLLRARGVARTAHGVWAGRGNRWVKVAERSGKLVRHVALRGRPGTGASMMPGSEVLATNVDYRGVLVNRVYRNGRSRTWKVDARGDFVSTIYLAEAYGRGALVIFAVGDTPGRVRYRVAILGSQGTARQRTLPMRSYTEFSVSGRFRREGRTLFFLESTKSGARVSTAALGREP